MNVSWWVERWSELDPEKLAIAFEGSRISYKNLQRRTDETCCWVRSLGVETGDRVAVFLDNCLEFIDLYLACARLGAVFVPVNVRLAPPELEYILDDCCPRLFVFQDRYAESLLALGWNRRRPKMLLGVTGQATAGSALGAAHALSEREVVAARKPFLAAFPGLPDPEAPHVIMYTSGTTGRPKGAVLSYRKTFFNCLNADIFFQLSSDDVMLVVLPLFHSGGLFIQASPILYKGGSLVIHPRFDAARTYRDIEIFRVTKFLGVPTVYRSLLGVEPDERRDVGSLQVCAIGGERTTPDLIDRCRREGFRLRQVMGQTETSILLWASEDDLAAKPGTVGRPVFHAEVRVVDREGHEVGPGHVGEIAVRGSIMMREYWQDPVQTAQTIRNGWLSTGDLARVDEDGYFFLVDRSKDVYISGGENVYPAEVEHVLRNHPGIEDVAVIGVPDERWGEVGRAFVIPKNGHPLGVEEILSYCEERLARYKWPRYVEIRDTLPRTALGKVCKYKLRDFRPES